MSSLAAMCGSSPFCDGYGLTSASVIACSAPSGRVATPGDCDDTRSTVNPARPEVCDPSDLDEDCDGLADDGDSSAAASTMTTLYYDEDLDGYGSSSDTLTACDTYPLWVTISGDCGPTRADVHPGGTEVCDTAYVDEDCDGTSDDAPDGDADGTCDLLDPCPVDEADDSDGDGACDSDDPCPADAPDDPDGDGACGADLCDGDDASGDSDSDGICDDTDFLLETTPMTPGGTLSLRVYRGPPRTMVHFFASRQAGTTCAPGGTTCLDLRDVMQIGSVRTDTSGQGTLLRTLPSTLPVGTTWLLQAAWVSGPAGDTTNVVSRTVVSP